MLGNKNAKGWTNPFLGVLDVLGGSILLFYGTPNLLIANGQRPTEQAPPQFSYLNDMAHASLPGKCGCHPFDRSAYDSVPEFTHARSLLHVIFPGTSS